MKKTLNCCLLLTVLFSACQSYDEVEFYNRGQQLVDDYHGDTEKLREAALIFQEILDVNPNSIYGLTGIGRVCYKSGYIAGSEYKTGALKEAQQIFAKAISIDPTFFDAYYYGFYPYLFEKDFTNARKMIYNAKAIDPESSRLNLLFAELAYREKNYDEALQKALLLSEDFDKEIKSRAFDIITDIYELKNDNEQAELYHKKIIKLEENSPWAYHNYAIFLSHTKRYDEAIANYEKALSIMRFGAAMKGLGLAYYKKGSELYEKKDFLPARKLFELSLRYYPDYDYSLYCLGMTYYYTGYNNKNVEDIKKARLYLSRALEIDNSFEMARKQLNSVNNLLANLGVS